MSRGEKLAVIVTAALFLAACVFLGVSGRGEKGYSLSALPEAPVTAADAEAIAFPIDLNTATVRELSALPGIGETRAAAIAAYREENGAFSCVEDVTLVQGIGEGLLEGFREYVTVG